MPELNDRRIAREASSLKEVFLNLKGEYAEVDIAEKIASFQTGVIKASCN